MKIKELITELQRYDQNLEVQINSSNGEYCNMDIEHVILVIDKDKKPEYADYILIEGCYQI